jgi:beta-glucosidase
VDRVKALKAGLDLEMPHTDGINDARVKQAVEDGVLAESILDETAERVIEMMLKAREREPLRYDAVAHHSLAARVATESAVLLKNEGGILPGSRDARTAVIGAMAKESRYQGAGSSKIVPLRLDNAWDELKALGVEAEYAEGYRLETNEEEEDLVQEACRVAQGKDIVYLFAGLPDRYEAESFDRTSMAMPENQNRLIEAVSAVNPNLVVVLMGGAPMELPWADKARAILLMYLGGEACGQACAALLLGKSTPSGRLAETWPMKGEDNPSSPYFPGYPLTVEYREGPFIGYRYYDSAGVNVRFPFGFGLSYTSFAYRELSVSKGSLDGLDDEVHICCKVKNTGGRAGKEVAQVYVHWKDSRIIRPEQELKGFAKVALEAGEEKEVEVILTGADLAYYNVKKGAWALEEGTVEIRVGAGSRDLRLNAEVKVKGTPHYPPPDLQREAPCYYDLSAGWKVSDAEFETLLGHPIPARERVKGSPHTTVSTFTDIQDRWLGRRLIALLRSQIDKMPENAEDVKMMAQNMLMDAPLHFVTMMEGGFTTNQVEGLVDLLNGKMVRGLIRLLKKAPR